MKIITVLFISLILNNLQTFSQKVEKDKREIQEIKLIFKAISSKKMNLPIYIEPNGLILPGYFTSYKEFIERLKKDSDDDYFLNFQSLSTIDQKQLNNSLTNDTVKFYIQKEWFINNNINILSESETNDQNNKFRKFIKPIFYRNFTRCYFACFYGVAIDVFFLKKVNNNWINDKKMHKTVEY
jgi:hypothetical protein